MNLSKANFRSSYSKDSSKAFYLEFSVIFKLFYKYHQRKLKEVNFNITYTKSSTLTVSILTEISFSQKMIFLKFHDFPLIFMEFLLISAKKVKNNDDYTWIKSAQPFPREFSASYLPKEFMTLS